VIPRPCSWAMKSWLAALLLVLVPGLATAQSGSAVNQTGGVVTGHTAMWVSNRVVKDGGFARGATAPSQGIGELLQVNPATPPGSGPDGTHTCLYSAPITQSYNWLCFDANALGGPLIDAGGTSRPALQFKINGVLYPFPGGGGGGILGPSVSTVDEPAIWSNTTGTLLGDGYNVSIVHTGNFTLVGTFLQSLTGNWFSDSGGIVDRFADRVLVGGATTNDGKATPSTLDWFSTLEISWGLSAGACDFAVICSETPASSAANGGSTGILGASQSYYSSSAGPSSIGVFGAGVTNNTTYQTASWGGYFENHVTAAPGGYPLGYGVEIEQRVLFEPGTPNAYAQAVSSVLELGCGAGLSGTGQKDCSTYIQFSNPNPKPAHTGIVAINGSLDTTLGLGGGGKFAELASGMDLVWRSGVNTVLVDLYGSSYGLVSSGNIVAGPAGPSGFGAGRSFICDAPVSTICGFEGRVNGVFGFYLSTDAVNYTALISQELDLDLGANGATKVVISNGMQIGSPTGGDEGAGTLNMTGCYVNGVACATGTVGMATNGSNATSGAMQALSTAAGSALLSVGGQFLAAGNPALTPSTAWMEAQFPNTAGVSQLTGIATWAGGGYGVVGGCQDGLPPWQHIGRVLLRGRRLHLAERCLVELVRMG
jgi:hypothetical protein